MMIYDWFKPNSLNACPLTGIHNLIAKLILSARGPLFKNSAYIMLTSLSVSGFGLLFWIIATNLYSNEDVGIASAIISSISLIVLLSKFGFDQSIIRYFPYGNKSHILSTSIIIASIIATVLGFAFISLVDLISPTMSVIKEYALIYIVILIISVMTPLFGYAFVAMRMGSLYFFQGLLQNLRVVFLFVFTLLGAIGIIVSIGASLILAIIFSISILYAHNIRLSKISKRFLVESWNFSMKNYLSGIFLAIPSLIIPLMVLNILGPEQNAYYYLSYSIAAVLFIIPNAINISLCVEGSHGESLRDCTLKSTIALFTVLLPGVFIVYIFGGEILNLLGTGYIGGLELLKTLALSSPFVAICQVYISVKKIQKDLNIVVLLSLFILISTSSLSYLLMICDFGITSVGYAWVLGHSLGAAGIGIITLRNKGLI